MTTQYTDTMPQPWQVEVRRRARQADADKATAFVTAGLGEKDGRRTTHALAA
jgi:hypothetical protein